MRSALKAQYIKGQQIIQMFNLILKIQNRKTTFLKVQDKSFLKGTVRVISSDPSSKDVNARFTTIPLKALSDKIWIFSILVFLQLYIYRCTMYIYAYSWCALGWMLFYFFILNISNKTFMPKKLTKNNSKTSYCFLLFFFLFVFIFRIKYCKV